MIFCVMGHDIAEDELWRLEYSEEMDGVVDGPGARHGHAAVTYDQAMWVCGGMSGLQTRLDLWRWSYGTYAMTR